MRPATIFVVVLAVGCHAIQLVSCQSSAPNQQTGPKPLLGITVNQPSGEQIWPISAQKSTVISRISKS